jgi:hypothetical protein
MTKGMHTFLIYSALHVSGFLSAHLQKQVSSPGYHTTGTGINGLNTETFLHNILKIASYFNLLAPEFFKFFLAHPVCKMWIIQEPKKVALW